MVTPPAPQTWLKVVPVCMPMPDATMVWQRWYLALPLCNSDLPLRPDFPLLVRNILTYLAPTRLQSSYTDRRCCGDRIASRAVTGSPRPASGWAGAYHLAPQMWFWLT
jgi:hypothetical protein